MPMTVGAQRSLPIPQIAAMRHPGRRHIPPLSHLLAWATPEGYFSASRRSRPWNCNIQPGYSGAKADALCSTANSSPVSFKSPAARQGCGPNTHTYAPVT